MESMRRISQAAVRILNTAVIFYMANLYSLSRIKNFSWLTRIGVLLFIVINVFPSVHNVKLKSRRLRICGNGCELLTLFLLSTSCTAIYSLAGYFGWVGLEPVTAAPKFWLFHTLCAVLIEAIVFWNGIIRVYLTSVQLGIRWRIMGILCGWIPFVHLAALGKILQVVRAEVEFENEKLIINENRREQKICNTKYPILLVHGVFFRDSRYLNYWGRIPAELEKNGARIYYGNHQSAASVEDSGKELLERIRQIIEETGCEKVNLIAHSKGGLDARAMLSIPEASQHVASLTTINTPHRGCEFADYLLSKVSKTKQELIACTYNAALRKLGDTNPDFLAAVNDLTASACHARNDQVKDAEGVYYQSIGSKLNTVLGGRFPLNCTYLLVNHFDGLNDGLVGETSFPWGESYHFLNAAGRRGISHGDMIDLNRENVPGFDVREFYVQLVEELKEMGY